SSAPPSIGTRAESGCGSGGASRWTTRNDTPPSTRLPSGTRLSVSTRSAPRSRRTKSASRGRDARRGSGTRPTSSPARKKARGGGRALREPERLADGQRVAVLAGVERELGDVPAAHVERVGAARRRERPVERLEAPRVGLRDLGVDDLRGHEEKHPPRRSDAP